MFKVFAEALLISRGEVADSQLQQSIVPLNLNAISFNADYEALWDSNFVR